jgi:hypothetical protein
MLHRGNIKDILFFSQGLGTFFPIPKDTKLILPIPRPSIIFCLWGQWLMTAVGVWNYLLLHILFLFMVVIPNVMNFILISCYSSSGYKSLICASSLHQPFSRSSVQYHVSGHCISNVIFCWQDKSCLSMNVLICVHFVFNCYAFSVVCQYDAIHWSINIYPF